MAISNVVPHVVKLMKAGSAVKMKWSVKSIKETSKRILKVSVF